MPRAGQSSTRWRRTCFWLVSRCVSSLGTWAKTHNPGILQRHHVVDVDIAGGRPCRAVVGAEPRSGGGCAGRADDDIGAVALEDELTGTSYVSGFRTGGK